MEVKVKTATVANMTSKNNKFPIKLFEILGKKVYNFARFTIKIIK